LAGSLGLVVSDRDLAGPWSLVRVSGVDEGFRVLSSLDDGKPVVFVFDGVWGRVGDLLRVARSKGLNELYFDFVDAGVEGGLLGGVAGLNALVYARLLRLRFSDVSRAPVRLSLGKIISRRDLLRAGPIATLEFLVRPVVDEGPCSSLRGCTMCVNVCPVKALSGKPPTVDYDKCALCGLCFSICPVEAIHSPQLTPKAVEAFIAAIRESVGESLNVVIVEYEALQDLSMELVDGGVQPTIVIPVWSLAEITPLALLKLSYHGFTPVIYDKRGVSLEGVLAELAGLGVIRIARSLEELKAKIREEPLFNVGEADITARGYALKVLERVKERATLNFPGAGHLEVDESLCTLCGACTRTCPTNALTVLEEETVKLTLKVNECIGCRECEITCPEGAIKVKWAFERGVLERTLAESPIARCVKCGAPLGPEALIASVEKKLGITGDIAQRHTRLCVNCKTLSILEGSLKPSP